MTDVMHAGFVGSTEDDVVVLGVDDEWSDFVHRAVEGATVIEVKPTGYRYYEVGTSIVGAGAPGLPVLWQLAGTIWPAANLARHSRSAMIQDRIVGGMIRELVVGYVRPAATSAPSRRVSHTAAVQDARLVAGDEFEIIRSAPQPRRPNPKSAWADAIGPLYTCEAAAEESGLTVVAITQSIEAGALLAIQSAEGDSLLPVMQFGSEGRTVGGLGWILSQLSSDVIDPYMLAAWMNTPRAELEDRSPWTVLREERRVSDSLKRLVLDLRRRFVQ